MDPRQPGPMDVPVSDRDRMVIYLAVLIALFLAALDQTIVATALPKMVEDLQGIDRYAWVATAYLLASTGLALVYGNSLGPFEYYLSLAHFQYLSDGEDGCWTQPRVKHKAATAATIGIRRFMGFPLWFPTLRSLGECRRRVK